MKNSFIIGALIVLSCASSTLLAQQLTMDSVMQKVSKGKPYVFAILKAGKAAPKDEAVLKKMHGDHLVHLFQLEKEGKISIFGPITTEGAPLEGIIIFNTADKEVAKKQLLMDPYIKDGYMAFELYDFFTIPGQKIPVN